MNETATLWWDAGNQSIRYIEQTLLPGEYTVVECRSIERLATAIKRLEIRVLPHWVLPGHMELHSPLCLQRKQI